MHLESGRKLENIDVILKCIGRGFWSRAQERDPKNLGSIGVMSDEGMLEFLRAFGIWGFRVEGFWLEDRNVIDGLPWNPALV